MEKMMVAKSFSERLAIKRVFLVPILFGVLSGCASFNTAMDLQNDYAANMSTTSSPRIQMRETVYPEVRRGVVETRYSAVIPKGMFIPVADSNGRTFFQAPPGFQYLKADNVESRVGGLVQVQRDDDLRYYVWFFPNQKEYFQIEPNGQWVQEIKPGLSNIVSRPWVEQDLMLDYRSK